MKYLGIEVLMVRKGKDVKSIKAPKSIKVKIGKKVVACPVRIMTADSLAEIESSVRGDVKNIFKVASTTFDDPQEKKAKTCPNCGEQLELNFD